MDLVKLMEIAAALLAADAEVEALHGELKRLDVECIPTQAYPRESVRAQIAEARKIVDAAIKEAAKGVRG